MDFGFYPPEADKNCGGAEYYTAGIHQYFEDITRGTNEEFGPKDFFEIASGR